jgi:VWFA-related protein
MLFLVSSPILASAFSGEMLEIQPGQTVVNSAAGSQQQTLPKESYTITAKTVLVTVDAVVRTATGGFVGSMQAGDFAVYDNGVAQKISFCSRERLPLAVAFVVDRSPSVQPYLAQLRAAALMALQHLKPEDQVALFSFDMFTSKLNDLTADHLKIAQRISHTSGGNGTNIYEGLYTAARYLRKEAPERRRVIILVSDNVPSIYGAHDRPQALMELLEGEVTIYSLRTHGENPPEYQGQIDWGRVGQTVWESGGEVLDAETGAKLAEALDQVIMDLQHAYVLGFAPSDEGPEGSYHRLEVKVNVGARCPDCRVQARRGYYAGVTASARSLNSSRKTSRPAAKPLMLSADLEELIAQNQIIAARNASAELQDIRFEVGTAVVNDDNGQSQLKVDMKINPANISFRILEDRHIARVHIAIFCENTRGKQLAADWKILDLSLSEATYQKIPNEGIDYSITLPLKAPKQVIKIVLYDPGNDRIGTKLIRLPLP